jgi:acyl-CoA hydrolase
MTQLVLPSHINARGTIFGGTVVSWIDVVAAIAAQRHSNSDVVTASIDELDFVAPVYMGWVVNLKASVNFVARTSMEVGVRVDAENPMTGETFHTSSAYLTFVALDRDGKPKEIPGISLESPDEKRRHQEATQRRIQRVAARKKNQKRA